MQPHYKMRLNKKSLLLEGFRGSLAKTCVEEENQENPDLCCCAL